MKAQGWQWWGAKEQGWARERVGKKGARGEWGEGVGQVVNGSRHKSEGGEEGRHC